MQLGDTVGFWYGGDLLNGVLAYRGPKYANSHHVVDDDAYWAAGERKRFAGASSKRKRFDVYNRYLVRRSGGWWYSPAVLEGEAPEAKGYSQGPPEPAGEEDDMRLVKADAKKAQEAAETEQEAAPEAAPAVVQLPVHRQLVTLVTDGSNGPDSVQMTHELVIAKATRRNITLNLPPVAMTPGQALTIKRLTGGKERKVYIKGNGSDLIDGSGTLTLHEPWQHVTIYALGDRWAVIG